MRARRYRSILQTVVLAAVIVWCAVSVGFAQASDQEAEKNNTLNVYLWGASISGDLSFPAGSQSFDVSLEQILDNLDLAAMVAYTRDFGDWSILLDVIYLNLGADNNGTVTIGGIVGAGNPVSSGSQGTIARVTFIVTGGSYPNGQTSQLQISNYTDDIAGMSPEPANTTFTLRK